MICWWISRIPFTYLISQIYRENPCLVPVFRLNVFILITRKISFHLPTIHFKQQCWWTSVHDLWFTLYVTRTLKEARLEATQIQLRQEGLISPFCIWIIHPHLESPLYCSLHHFQRWNQLDHMLLHLRLYWNTLCEFSVAIIKLRIQCNCRVNIHNSTFIQNLG